jgi:hypothetical protein
VPQSSARSTAAERVLARTRGRARRKQPHRVQPTTSMRINELVDYGNPERNQ